MTVELDVESAAQPAGAAEMAMLRGQRFFNTGLGRWSENGWGACVACHPFGLSDNVTWSFVAGPRQTLDTSATFDSSGTVQRILNWTAIFDEIHDFELYTRNVSNGTGAVVDDLALNADGTPNTAARIDFVGPGGPADPENAFNVGSVAAVSQAEGLLDDWDDIRVYLATLPSANGRTRVAGDPVDGGVVFQNAGCHKCHGGPLWTLAELYYDPVLDGDLRSLTLFDAGVTTVGSVPAAQVRTTDTTMMSVLENDTNGTPHRHSCTVRIVGTFAADGAAGRGASEVRANGLAAQGVDGYNVPSLLGVNLGAPYLHNGAAETLEELLDPSGSFVSHLQAGNQVFSPTPGDLTDLIAFLQTIDDQTPIIDVPATQRFCPTGIVPP
jgi:mono/diheme cytochrome c family protein